MSHGAGDADHPLGRGWSAAVAHAEPVPRVDRPHSSVDGFKARVPVVQVAIFRIPHDWQHLGLSVGHCGIECAAGLIVAHITLEPQQFAKFGNVELGVIRGPLDE